MQIGVQGRLDMENSKETGSQEAGWPQPTEVCEWSILVANEAFHIPGQLHAMGARACETE